MPVTNASPDGRSEQRGQDLHRRRLAGPVRADQAEDLAVADDEVEAGDGELVVVALHEAAGLDDGDADHRSSTPATWRSGRRRPGRSPGCSGRRSRGRRSARSSSARSMDRRSSNRLCWPRSPSSVHAPLVGSRTSTVNPSGQKPPNPPGSLKTKRRIRPDDDLDLGRHDPGRLERAGRCSTSPSPRRGSSSRRPPSSHRPRSRSRRRPSGAGGS